MVYRNNIIPPSIYYKRGNNISWMLALTRTVRIMVIKKLFLYPIGNKKPDNILNHTLEVKKIFYFIYHI